MEGSEDKIGAVEPVTHPKRLLLFLQGYSRLDVPGDGNFDPAVPNCGRIVVSDRAWPGLSPTFDSVVSD
jgi:hypothetical protein